MGVFYWLGLGFLMDAIVALQDWVHSRSKGRHSSCVSTVVLRCSKLFSPQSLLLPLLWLCGMDRMKARAWKVASKRFERRAHAALPTLPGTTRPTSGRPKTQAISTPTSMKVFKLSTTLSIGGADDDPLLLACLEMFLREEIIVGKLYLKRNAWFSTYTFRC